MRNEDTFEYMLDSTLLILRGMFDEHVRKLDGEAFAQYDPQAMVSDVMEMAEIVLKYTQDLMGDPLVYDEYRYEQDGVEISIRNAALRVIRREVERVMAAMMQDERKRRGLNE